MEQKIPAKRLQHYGIIAVLTVITSLLFAYASNPGADGFIIYLIIDVIFLQIVLYMLESSRLSGKLGDSLAGNYRRIADWYGVFCAVAAGCFFLPEFVCPAAATALFFAMASTAEIAITLGTFLCVLLCMAHGGNFYELAAYVVLILIGAQLAKTMRKKQLRFWGCIVLMSVSVCIPVLFYYLSYRKSSFVLFCYSFIFGAFFVLLFVLFSERLYGRSDREDSDIYEKIIDEAYPFVVDIKNYSRAEYIRAVKAATLARKCAAEIGANELAAAAAGFYYRLGILEGEPFIENGVRLAQEGCFPAAVISILAEYGGEEKLPSTRESAIVHMVDACMNKIAFLCAQEISASWSPEMVIYQTLNELSAAGTYDESGLSMNQFLKVRELLVHEEIGYDSTNGRRNEGQV